MAANRVSVFSPSEALPFSVVVSDRSDSLWEKAAQLLPLKKWLRQKLIEAKASAKLSRLFPSSLQSEGGISAAKGFPYDALESSRRRASTEVFFALETSPLLETLHLSCESQGAASGLFPIQREGLEEEEKGHAGRDSEDGAASARPRPHRQQLLVEFRSATSLPVIPLSEEVLTSTIQTNDAPSFSASSPSALAQGTFAFSPGLLRILHNRQEQRRQQTTKVQGSRLRCVVSLPLLSRVAAFFSVTQKLADPRRREKEARSARLCLTDPLPDSCNFSQKGGEGRPVVWRVEGPSFSFPTKGDAERRASWQKRRRFSAETNAGDLESFDLANKSELAERLFLSSDSQQPRGLRRLGSAAFSVYTKSLASARNFASAVSVLREAQKEQALRVSILEERIPQTASALERLHWRLQTPPSRLLVPRVLRTSHWEVAFDAASLLIPANTETSDCPLVLLRGSVYGWRRVDSVGNGDRLFSASDPRDRKAVLLLNPVEAQEWESFLPGLRVFKLKVSEAALTCVSNASVLWKTQPTLLLDARRRRLQRRQRLFRSASFAEKDWQRLSAENNAFSVSEEASLARTLEELQMASGRPNASSQSPTSATKTSSKKRAAQDKEEAARVICTDLSFVVAKTKLPFSPCKRKKNVLFENGGTEGETKKCLCCGVCEYAAPFPESEEEEEASSSNSDSGASSSSSFDSSFDSDDSAGITSSASFASCPCALHLPHENTQLQVEPCVCEVSFLDCLVLGLCAAAQFQELQKWQSEESLCDQRVEVLRNQIDARLESLLNRDGARAFRVDEERRAANFKGLSDAQGLNGEEDRGGRSALAWFSPEAASLRWKSKPFPALLRRQPVLGRLVVECRNPRVTFLNDQTRERRAPLVQLLLPRLRFEKTFAKSGGGETGSEDSSRRAGAAEASLSVADASLLLWAMNPLSATFEPVVESLPVTVVVRKMPRSLLRFCTYRKTRAADARHPGFLAASATGQERTSSQVPQESQFFSSLFFGAAGMRLSAAADDEPSDASSRSAACRSQDSAASSAFGGSFEDGAGDVYTGVLVQSPSRRPVEVNLSPLFLEALVSCLWKWRKSLGPRLDLALRQLQREQSLRRRGRRCALNEEDDASVGGCCSDAGDTRTEEETPRRRRCWRGSRSWFEGSSQKRGPSRNSEEKSAEEKNAAGAFPQVGFAEPRETPLKRGNSEEAEGPLKRQGVSLQPHLRSPEAEAQASPLRPRRYLLSTSHRVTNMTGATLRIRLVHPVSASSAAAGEFSYRTQRSDAFSACLPRVLGEAESFSEFDFSRDRTDSSESSDEEAFKRRVAECPVDWLTNASRKTKFKSEAADTSTQWLELLAGEEGALTHVRRDASLDSSELRAAIQFAAGGFGRAASEDVEWRGEVQVCLDRLGNFARRLEDSAWRISPAVTSAFKPLSPFGGEAALPSPFVVCRLEAKGGKKCLRVESPVILKNACEVPLEFEVVVESENKPSDAKGVSKTTALRSEETGTSYSAQFVVLPGAVWAVPLFCEKL